ncbi:MAG: M48 family metallopeptidase [Methanosphaera sp.]|nr:M48 family metallopeptidase [Methanosphaera sp.]
MWTVDRKIYINIDGKKVLLKIINDKKIKKIKRVYYFGDILARVPEGKYTDEYLERYFNMPYLKKWFNRLEKKFEGSKEVYERDAQEIGLELEDRTTEELRTIIEKYVDKFTPQFGRPKQIIIRPIFEVWGRCSSSKDKLSFNPVMKYLPENLIEFVVYHEMIHTYCLNHNPPFYREMAKRYPDWKDWDYNLDTYAYIITSKHDILF